MSKTITRRGFVGGAAIAAAGAAAVLTGCDGDSTATNADGSAKKVLRFGQSNAKAGLDMQHSTSSLSSSIVDCIFESPLRMTDDNEIVPCLLTEVPSFEDDGVTLHCTLKEGIKCHDGSTLTANDVKFSFERMFNPENPAMSSYLYDMIKGAKDMLNGEATELEGLTVEDDTHFTFVLDEPIVSFIDNLAINYADIFPQAACEAAGDQWGWGTNCVGTGKYKVVSNDDTTEVVLEKFADYHDGEPALDEVHIIFYDDNNTKMLAFKNGDIDWCDLDPTLLQQYQADPDIAPLITQYDTLGIHFVSINLKEGMGLEDERVREALSISINRQELVDTVLAGAGTPAMAFLGPKEDGYDPNAEIPYDPERAKELLSEAGVSGLTLEAKIRANLYETYMTVVQSYWKEIGVTLNLTVEDAGVWQSDWASGGLQVTCLSWTPLTPDGIEHMYSYFHSDYSAGKSSYYNNPEYDKLLEEGRVEADPDKHAELAREADNLLTHVDFGTIPLYWPKNAFVAKSYVKNAKVGNLIYHMIDIDIDTEDPNYSA